MDQYIGPDFMAIMTNRITAESVGRRHLRNLSETAMKFLDSCSDDEFFREYYLHKNCVWISDMTHCIIYIITNLSAELFAYIISQLTDVRRITMEISDRYKTPSHTFLAITTLDNKCEYKTIMTKTPVTSYKMWDLNFCRYDKMGEGSSECWMYHINDQ